MRIVHCCLANFYIDGYNYQENVLPLIHKEQGHDVFIIASTETYGKDGKLTYTMPGEYVNKEGITIVRLDYKLSFTGILAKKIRKYKYLTEALYKFNPDVIFIHGLAFLDLTTVVTYARKHGAELVGDTHGDENNSARNFFSRFILHKMVYAYCIRKNFQYFARFYGASEECRLFFSKYYKIPINEIGYLPLGGIIYDDNTYLEYRNNKRRELKCKENDIVIVHSGKLELEKKTKYLLSMMEKVKDNSIKLIIIGNLPNQNVKDDILYAVARDKRISYLGWKPSGELLEYLCACDIYAQPGTQSATMQNAACCRCALLLYPYPSHLKTFGNMDIYVKNCDDIIGYVQKCLNDNGYINDNKNKIFDIAKKQFDYYKQAEKVLGF